MATTDSARVDRLVERDERRPLARRLRPPAQEPAGHRRPVIVIVLFVAGDLRPVIAPYPYHAQDLKAVIANGGRPARRRSRSPATSWAPTSSAATSSAG